MSLQEMKAYKSLEAHNYFTSHAGATKTCRRFERGELASSKRVCARAHICMCARARLCVHVRNNLKALQ